MFCIETIVVTLCLKAQFPSKGKGLDDDDDASREEDYVEVILRRQKRLAKNANKGPSSKDGISKSLAQSIELLLQGAIGWQ